MRSVIFDPLESKVVFALRAVAVVVLVAIAFTLGFTIGSTGSESGTSSQKPPSDPTKMKASDNTLGGPR